MCDEQVLKEVQEENERLKAEIALLRQSNERLREAWNEAVCSRSSYNRRQFEWEYDRLEYPEDDR